ncbi:hypothetical protein AB6A40_009232 [Gnathostoma spinigerum]|uniref:Uncharacterized protein n=1 Tax=Gnathostoma spinigerum TaxID=75299 RepID=A0ABD6ERE3_9BILA
MLPFSGPPGFHQLIGLPSNPAQPFLSQQQQFLLPSISSIPSIQRVITVSSTPPQLLQASVVASPITAPRPMLVPPQMAAEIAAANASANAAATTAVVASSAPRSPASPITKSSSNDPNQVWSEHISKDGRPYYYNKITKQSCWAKPEEMKSAVERLEKGVWQEFKTAEGKPYYYNTETKETTWIRPRCFEVAMPKVERSDNRVQSSAAAGDINTPAVSAGESDIEKAMMATLKSLDDSEKKDDESNANENGENIVTEASDEEKNAKKKQSDVFRELLCDKCNEGKITSASSWEQAMKYIQNDPRFRVLGKVSEKKQIFNAWKVQRQKDERDEKRLAIKKAKEDLEQWLRSQKIRPTMRYAKACDQFADEPVWKAVHDSERREIFKDAMEFLDKKEKNEIRAIRRRNVRALSDILEGMEEITYRTTWAQAQRLLIENPAFANDITLQSMDKEDALIIFEDHIRTAEKLYMKEKELEERRRKRRERKVREAFQAYLVELHKRGNFCITF